MKFSDRMLQAVGLRRIRAEAGPGFRGAAQNRFTADWAVAIMSEDQKIRASLKVLRHRSRQLVNDNEYAQRFLLKARENVIGPNGVALQMSLPEEQFGASAEKFNRAVELAWSRWSETVTADGQMSIVDAAQQWLGNVATDGEDFVRRLKGFPDNDCRFALQFIDPDQVDVAYNRLRRQLVDGRIENEIRLGVEINEWHRPLAYWMFDHHPAEIPGVRRIPVSAGEVAHTYVFKLRNQTRGVPFFASAMTRMNMLGGYEEAELIGARVAACKMAVFTSKTGDDYKGAGPTDTGGVELVAQPGLLEQLPDGVDVKPIDWNHPNQNFSEFTKSMLRGVAMGLNTSYSTLSGDLRDVNFSSIRQGVLDEREGWKVLQTFAVRHFFRPVFRDWLLMALTAGQLDLPSSLPLAVVAENALWTPRGWDWVDPRADVDADIKGIRAGMSTLQESCARRGRDWRDVLQQRAKEIALAKTLGVPLDFTTAGSGGVEGDTTDEDQKGVQPTKPGTPPPARPNTQPKGQPYVRLEQ